MRGRRGRQWQRQQLWRAARRRACLRGARRRALPQRLPPRDSADMRRRHGMFYDVAYFMSGREQF